MRTQMMAEKAGALVDSAKQWKAIDWQKTRRQVRGLQIRIAKALRKVGGVSNTTERISGN